MRMKDYISRYMALVMLFDILGVLAIFEILNGRINGLTFLLALWRIEAIIPNIIDYTYFRVRISQKKIESLEQEDHYKEACYESKE